MKRAASQLGQEQGGVDDDPQKKIKNGPSLSELGMDPVDALKRQRSGMLLRLEEQRREITELRANLGKTTEAQLANQQLISTIRRHWQEIDEQAQVLISRVSPADSSLNELPRDVKTEDLTKLVEGSDGTLGLIRSLTLTNEIPDAVNAERLEEALQRRVDWTKAVLARLVEALSKQAPSKDPEQNALQNRFQELQAQYAESQNAARGAFDALQVAETEKRDVEKQLSNCMVDLEKLRRDVDRLTERLKEAELRPASQALSSSSTSAATANEGSEASKELKEVNMQLVARTEEIKGLVKQIAALEEELKSVGAELDKGQHDDRISKLEEELQLAEASQSHHQQLYASAIQRMEDHKNQVVKAQQDFEKRAHAQKALQNESRKSLEKELAAVKAQYAELIKKKDLWELRDGEPTASTARPGTGALKALKDSHAQELANGEKKREQLRSKVEDLNTEVKEEKKRSSELKQELAAMGETLRLAREEVEREAGRNAHVLREASAAEEAKREIAVVLKLWKQKGSADARAEKELRESELRLKSQVESLERQLKELQGGSLELPASIKEKWDGDLKKELTALNERCALLAREKQSALDTIAQLERDIEGKSQESAALMGELGAISGAFGELEARNSELLEKVAAKNETRNEMEQLKTAHRQQLKLMTQRTSTFASQITEMNKTIARMKDHAKSQDNLIHQHDVFRSKVEAEATLFKSMLDSETNIANDAKAALAKCQQKLENMAGKSAEKTTTIEKLLAERRAMHAGSLQQEAKIDSLTRTLVEYQKHGSDQLLKEQLRALKHSATCNLCSDRYKNTCIVDCMHTFCKECIDERVALRNRKCPTCGVTFKPSSIKSIYMDWP